MSWEISITLHPDVESSAALDHNPGYTQILYENDSFALSEHEFFRLTTTCRIMLEMWAKDMSVEEAKVMAKPPAPDDEETDK